MLGQPFCTSGICFLKKDELSAKLLAQNWKRESILILLSANGEKRWDIRKYFDVLQENNNLLYYSKSVCNPTEYTIADVLELIDGRSINRIIAIGGGSTIDLAKAISACSLGNICKKLTPEKIKEIILTKAYQKNTHPIPLIVFPTAAGTGAEVTQWATVWDGNTHQKHSIDFAPLKPEQVAVMLELIQTIPPLMLLQTSLDAMMHAIEAYWSIHTNPLVQKLSLEAIEKIVHLLPRALKDAKQKFIIDDLYIASLLAGLAFSQTRTTACHSIAYPLTGEFKIPHGIAVAMTLNPIALKNAQVINLDEIYILFQQDGGIDSWLKKVSNGVAAMKLSEYGVKIEDLPTIAQNSFTAGRMDNNPYALGYEDVLEVLSAIY